MDLEFVVTKTRHALTHFDKATFADNILLDRLCLESNEIELEEPALSKEDRFKNYLLRKLAELRQRNELYSKILHTRYIQSKTILESIYHLELDTGESHFSNNLQPAALYELASMILKDHHKQIEERSQTLKHIPARDYDKLFGIEEPLDKLLTYLYDEQSHWATMITGMGGVGKTAIVRECVRKIIEETCYFDGVVWATAKRRRFRGSPRLDSELDLDLDKTLDTFLKQLNIIIGTSAPLETKKEKIHSVLKSARYLIVFDNLETLAELQQVLPIIEALYEMSNPSKVLLTSRITIETTLPIAEVPIKNLEKSDAMAFAEYYVKHYLPVDFDEIAHLMDKLWQVTKGNPLATILVLSQLRSEDLETVLNNLLNAIGEKHDQYYKFVFADIWERLGEDEQGLMKLLVASPRIEGEKRGVLQKLSELSPSAFTNAISKLVSYSLVNSTKGITEYQYTLHPLTRHFVLLKLGVAPVGEEDG